MEFIDRIKKVLNSELLSKDLSDIPTNGASEAMIKKEEEKLPRKLSLQHKEFLKNWNGANLDFIRVFGVHPVENDFLKELAKENKEWEDVVKEVGENSIYFANDITGFMYFELEDGSIVYLDTDGGEIKKVADDINDFFLNYIFGKRADEYGDTEWLDELKEYEII